MLRGAISRYRLRVVRGVEKYGFREAIRRAARNAVVVDDEYVWYALDLERLTPIPLREGYELRQATEDDVGLLRSVPAIPVEEGRKRLARGEQLWFVMHGEEPAFACTVFLHILPLEAARKRSYRLPPRVACVDDGLTNRQYRGRAIAAAAWVAIGEALRASGYQVLIAKVPLDNIPSRRTHEKTGFQPMSTMRRRRRGVRTRVRFEDTDAELTDVERLALAHLRAHVSR